MFSVIIISIVILFLSRIILDQFENNVEKKSISFLTVQQIIDYIQRDKDGYINSLNTLDLIARKSSSSMEYIKRVCEDMKGEDHIDPYLQRRIEICCMKAQEYFQKTSSTSKYYDTNIDNIQWNIAVFSTIFYEDGIPHTREKTIFLHKNHIEKLSNAELTSLLIHEKIHIYQRYHQDTDKIYDMGFRKMSKRDGDMFNRSNPDLDKYIYMDVVNSKIMCKRYKSIYPKNIKDVIEPSDNNNVHRYEHPYEYIAYQVEKEYETDYIRRSKN